MPLDEPTTHQYTLELAVKDGRIEELERKLDAVRELVKEAPPTYWQSQTDWLAKLRQLVR